MSEPTRQFAVTLCADDFGLSPAIDEGIAKLAEAGRLQAVSCIASLARWPEASKRLRELPPGMSVGLHLALTRVPQPSADDGGEPDAAAPGPGGLLLRALAGSLDRAEIARTIDWQLDRFESATSRRPDHVDGHHHVHAMPGIAEVLRDRLLARYGRDLPWIRRLSPCLPLPTAPVRRWIIERLGRHQLRILRDTAFTANRAFGGVRNFREARPYVELLAAQLAAVAVDGTLVMCHPGLPSGSLPGDDIAPARPLEYAFLAGPELPALLARTGCRMAPLASGAIA